MLRWLRTKLVRWAEQYQRRRIEELLKETRALKAQLLEWNDGEPITLTLKERKLLAEKRKGIDPNVLREIDILDLETDFPLGRD